MATTAAILKSILNLQNQKANWLETLLEVSGAIYRSETKVSFPLEIQDGPHLENLFSRLLQNWKANWLKT